MIPHQKKSNAVLLSYAAFLTALVVAVLSGTNWNNPLSSEALKNVSVMFLVLFFAAAPPLAIALSILDTVYLHKRPGLVISVCGGALIAFGAGAIYGFGFSYELTAALPMGAAAAFLGALTGFLYWLLPKLMK